MLKLNHVSARYDVLDGYVNAVNDITFTLKNNEILGIAGESGCGKSSLLKVMYDLIEYPLEISEGVVELITKQGEKTVTYRSGEIQNRRWKEIAYVPQGAMHVMNPVKKIGAQFYDTLSASESAWKHDWRTANGDHVSQNHDTLNRGRKLTQKELKEKIISYLGELGLRPEVLDSYPHQLSGGMKQRVMIALATVQRPDIVLADEPTTALDVVVQREILTMISEVQKKCGNSIVIVSHDLGVHYQITDRLGIMYAGELIEIGPTDRLFAEPAHPYTKMLVNALPRIGDLSQKEGIPGTPPGLRNPPPGCRFAARCPQACDLCRTKKPNRYQIGEDHAACCHLLEGKYPLAADEKEGNSSE